MTAVALGESIGVTRQAVSRYEAGEISPSPEVLLRAAAVLRLPSEYFLRGIPEKAGVMATFYRSLAAATKSARVRGDRRLDWLFEVAAYAQRFVEFPDLDVPAYEGQDPEDAATNVRAAWALGDAPIGHVVWLLENHGVVLTRGMIDTNTIDAFSRWGPDDRPAIFLGADKESAVRSRFDALHELGHQVLHRSVMPREFGRPELFKRMELEAHAFASAFLLPSAGFAEDLWTPTLETMQVMKPKWGASLGVMIRRAAQLRILSPADATRLWTSRARRGWSTHEPLDDSLDPEQPMMLRRSFELIVNEGRIPRESILAELPLNPSDIEALANLPTGFFSDPEAPVRLLDRSVRRRAAQADDGSRGAMVQFPERASNVR